MNAVSLEAVKGSFRSTAPRLALWAFLLVYTACTKVNELPQSAQHPISQQIIGTWGVDVEKTMEAMKFTPTKKNEEDAPDDLVEIVKIFGRSTFEFNSSKTLKVQLPRKTEEGRYRILEADTQSGNFTLELEDGRTSTSDARIDKDKLTFEMEGIQLHLERLTEQQIKD